MGPHFKTIVIKTVRYWSKNRHTGKWNRRKSGGKTLQIHGFCGLNVYPLQNSCWSLISIATASRDKTLKQHLGCGGSSLTNGLMPRERHSPVLLLSPCPPIVEKCSREASSYASILILALSTFRYGRKKCLSYKLHSFECLGIVDLTTDRCRQQSVFNKPRGNTQKGKTVSPTCSAEKMDGHIQKKLYPCQIRGTETNTK